MLITLLKLIGKKFEKNLRELYYFWYIVYYI